MTIMMVVMMMMNWENCILWHSVHTVGVVLMFQSLQELQNFLPKTDWPQPAGPYVLPPSVTHSRLPTWDSPTKPRACSACSSRTQLWHQENTLTKKKKSSGIYTCYKLPKFINPIRLNVRRQSWIAEEKNQIFERAGTEPQRSKGQEHAWHNTMKPPRKIEGWSRFLYPLPWARTMVTVGQCH